MKAVECRKQIREAKGKKKSTSYFPDISKALSEMSDCNVANRGLRFTSFSYPAHRLSLKINEEKVPSL